MTGWKQIFHTYGTKRKEIGYTYKEEYYQFTGNTPVIKIYVINTRVQKYMKQAWAETKGEADSNTLTGEDFNSRQNIQREDKETEPE